MKKNFEEYLQRRKERTKGKERRRDLGRIETDRQTLGKEDWSIGRKNERGSTWKGEKGKENRGKENRNKGKESRSVEKGEAGNCGRKNEKIKRRVTRSYKEKANSNRPIGPYKAVRYLT